jgi:hypothetical protein
LERAFTDAGERVDVFVYTSMGEGEQVKFWHFPPEGEPRPVVSANSYRGLLLNDDDALPRPAILKIHGAINRLGGRDSWVISEDDYIRYLTDTTDISSLVPWVLKRKLEESNFLFLGYSLRDWNVRAILQRIWDRQAESSYNSWAIQLHPDELDQESWRQRGARIIDVDLDTYVAGLAERLQQLPTLESAAVAESGP